MTNFNPSSKFSAATHPTAQRKQFENQYWFHTSAGKSSEASEHGLFKQLGSWLLAFFTDAQQVRIWTKETPSGLVWYAYDPATQRRVSRVSEADLRVWLEARYQ